MLTDLAVIPIVILEAIGLRALLLTVGISNTVIYLCCLFLVYHLSFSSLLSLQLRMLQDSFVSRFELSIFAAVITTLVAIATYCIIGLFPILKFPFFFLRYLPYSSLWSDLFIVAVPTYFAHFLSRFVAQTLLK